MEQGDQLPLQHRMGDPVKIKPISKICDVFAWMFSILVKPRHVKEMYHASTNEQPSAARAHHSVMESLV